MVRLDAQELQGASKEKAHFNSTMVRLDEPIRLHETC